MIFLSKQLGLDARVDNTSNELILGDDITYDKKVEYTIDHVRLCLVNKNLDVPRYLYTVYRNLRYLSEKVIYNGDYRYDLLIMPPNITGIEFVKTHGHMTSTSLSKKYTYPVLIEVLYGIGTFFLQQFITDEDEIFGKTIKNVYHVKISKGEKIIIPPNYYVSIANTRSQYLITGRLKYKDAGESERKTIENKHGMSYFIIRKNARQTIVKNPNYKFVPRLKRIRNTELLRFIPYRYKKPIINVYKENKDKLAFLKFPSKFNWNSEEN